MPRYLLILNLELVGREDDGRVARHNAGTFEFRINCDPSQLQAEIVQRKDSMKANLEAKDGVETAVVSVVQVVSL